MSILPAPRGGDCAPLANPVGDWPAWTSLPVEKLNLDSFDDAGDVAGPRRYSRLIGRPWTLAGLDQADDNANDAGDDRRGSRR